MLSRKLEPQKPVTVADIEESSIEIEQDVWTQLPPKREFIVNMPVQQQGRARPIISNLVFGELLGVIL